MAATLEQLDETMHKASRALAQMDYLTCEALCLEALDAARRQGRWSYYARVLMPLQEARRQRRIIASAGDVQLGNPADSLSDWLNGHRAGCIALTRPNTKADAAGLHDDARQQRRYVEVLYADSEPSAQTWTLRSYAGPDVTCEVAAPTPEADPARWFIRATERLGDAALGGVDASLTGVERVEALEARLRVFPDHELLHQSLAEAARAVRA